MQSSVPRYPVNVTIDTRSGVFVHFLPTALNTYVQVDAAGYHYHDEVVQPLSVLDAYGYGGVVVFVDINGYSAYDLACPFCASKGKCRPCEIDGAYAVCPDCGEQYDLISGTAVPQKGLINETLRRLNVMNADGKLTITQRQ